MPKSKSKRKSTKVAAVKAKAKPAVKAKAEPKLKAEPKAEPKAKPKAAAPREMQVGDTVRMKGVAYIGNAPFDAKGKPGIVREITDTRTYVQLHGGGHTCWTKHDLVELQ